MKVHKRKDKKLQDYNIQRPMENLEKKRSNVFFKVSDNDDNERDMTTCPDCESCPFNWSVKK